MVNLTWALGSDARLAETLVATRQAYDFIRSSALGVGTAANAEFNLIGILHWIGDWDEAVDRVRTFGTSFPADLIHAGIVPVCGLINHGLFEEARSRLHPPVSTDPRAGGLYLVYAECSVQLAVWEGRPYDARDTLAQAQPPPDYRVGSLAWLAAWVEADIAERGAADTATNGPDETAALAWRNRLRRIIEHGTPNGNRPPKYAAFVLELIDGEISRMRGRSDPTPWRAAADHFAAHGFVYEAAYARFRLAEASSPPTTTVPPPSPRYATPTRQLTDWAPSLSSV
jgi:hypothetical protein